VRGRSLHTRSKKDRLKEDSPRTDGKYSTNSGRRKAERVDKRRKTSDASKQTASSMVKETLNKWSQRGQKVRELVKLLSDPFYLVKCYEAIRGKPGNMTKGTGPETLDGINID